MSKVSGTKTNEYDTKGAQNSFFLKVLKDDWLLQEDGSKFLQKMWLSKREIMAPQGDQ